MVTFHEDDMFLFLLKFSEYSLLVIFRAGWENRWNFIFPKVGNHLGPPGREVQFLVLIFISFFLCTHELKLYKPMIFVDVFF
jgi:hypothetical protein